MNASADGNVQADTTTGCVSSADLQELSASASLYVEKRDQSVGDNLHEVVRLLGPPVEPADGAVPVLAASALCVSVSVPSLVRCGLHEPIMYAINVHGAPQKPIKGTLPAHESVNINR